ncbi:MAG: MBL fold metallo-hydrolase [Pseudonocardia sp.]|nr:MBL fold metallo-hydrolase [Pseudonocardia sp.]
MALVGGAALLAGAAHGIPRAMGARPDDLRAAAARSPHAVAGRFRNTEPGAALRPVGSSAVLRALLLRRRTGRPARPVPLAAAPPFGPASPLAITWFGHSSVLVEIDGHRVLADPVWADRVSPSRLVGPRRLHPVPLPLAALPAIDAVVISHDHYDHLDMPTVRALLDLTPAPFLVPMGIGEHLRSWGVPEHRIVELDWGGSTTIGELTVTCTEARHFSGRGLTRNTTQWSSWAVTGPSHRVYFGGDTGWTTAFADIAAAWGPFDLTVLPVGAYSDQWPEIHMTPEEAVRAHGDLARDGGLLVPVHWATFNLGFHRWSEPADRLRAAAAAAGVRLVVPRPGERVDAGAHTSVQDWWSPIARTARSSGPELPFGGIDRRPHTDPTGGADGAAQPTFPARSTMGGPFPYYRSHK